MTDLGIWICWGLVGAVWAAGAMLASHRRRPVKRREKRDAASVAAAGIGLLVMATPQALWQLLTIGGPWLRLLGLAILVPAAFGAITARVALGAMWSSAAVTTQGQRLITTGSYAVTRNPIYTAILAMLLGTALAQGLGRWAALFLVVGLALLAKGRAEERLLSAEFGAEYRRYRKRVPRLLPRPWPRRKLRLRRGS